jgi:hypothetical protein
MEIAVPNGKCPSANLVYILRRKTPEVFNSDWISLKEIL